MNENDIIKINLIKAYKDLPLDSKRNEYSKEMLILTVLVNSLLSNYTNEQLHTPYNYRKGIDENITEDELLTSNYIDLLELKNNILLLFKFMDNPK